MNASPLHPADLAGAEVVVTGTSRGLGAALVDELVARGALVAAVDRHPVHDDDRTAVTRRVVDYRSPTELDELVDGAAESAAANRRWLGVIHNAGTLGSIAPLGELDAHDIEATVHINTVVGLQLANAAVRSAARHDIDARVLLVSSGAGRTPYDGWSIYCASKAALDHATRCVELERARLTTPTGRHTVVQSLRPGVIDTSMQAQIRAADIEAFSQRPRFDELAARGSLAAPRDAAKSLIDTWLDPTTEAVDG